MTNMKDEEELQKWESPYETAIRHWKEENEYRKENSLVHMISWEDSRHKKELDDEYGDY